VEVIMELVQRILQHPKYKEYLKLNAEAEKDRKFCCHNLQHALDVARVAYIISLENSYNLSKEIIYITALLHDIAKWKQYSEKTDHAEAGAVLAEGILRDIGVQDKDIEMIKDAIKNHRRKDEKVSDLSKVLYDADKSCRICVECEAINECKRFKDGKKPALFY